MYQGIISKFMHSINTQSVFVANVEPVLESKLTEVMNSNPELMAVIMISLKKSIKLKRSDLDSDEVIKDLFNDNDIDIDSCNKLISDISDDISWEETAEGISIKMNNHVAKMFNDGMKDFSISSNQKQVLYESSLINGVIYLELLFNRLMKKFIGKFPERLNSRKLTLDEIVSLGNLEEAKRYIIDSEVEGLLRKSFNEQLNYFKCDIGMDFSSIEKYIGEVNEIFQRRNLLVHNDGIVNSVYEKNVKIDFRKSTLKGSRLHTDNEYIAKALDTIEIIGLLIALETWKKELRKDSTERINFIISKGFDYLVEERWLIARELYSFLLRETNLSMNNKLLAEINYWQTYKWNDEFDVIKEEVLGRDFSAYDTTFQLCYAALIDDFDQFEILRPKALAIGFNEEFFETWPVFRGVRERKDNVIEVVSNEK